MINGLFIPHPEIPNHYEIGSGYIVLTSDFNQEHFKWSRLLRKNYVQDHGFLGHIETDRVDIQVYHQASEEQPWAIVEKKSVIETMKALMVEDSETILHYCRQGEVQSIITGIDYGTLSRLSEQYSQHYYEFRL